MGVLLTNLEEDLFFLIFVFFFQQQSRYIKGKKEFIANLMISLQKALDEAAQAIKENTEIDLVKLTESNQLSDLGKEK